MVRDSLPKNGFGTKGEESMCSRVGQGRGKSVVLMRLRDKIDVVFPQN